MNRRRAVVLGTGAVLAAGGLAALLSSTAKNPEIPLEAPIKKGEQIREGIEGVGHVYFAEQNRDLCGFFGNILLVEIEKTL